MEDKRVHHGGNGFLLGVVLGSVATLLLTTKKGREILKEVTDKGINHFSDLKETLEPDEEEYVDLKKADDYVETVPAKEPVNEAEAEEFEEKEKAVKSEEKKEEEKPKKSPPRKFFKAKK